MNSLSDFLNSGSAAQQSKKRTTVYVVCITVVLLIITLLVMMVSGIVYKVREGKVPDDSSDGDNSGASVRLPAGYTSTTFTENQQYMGDLILVDESHPSNAAPTVTLISGDANRPKDANGFLYTIMGTTTLSATQETINAFNQMFNAYYEQSNGDNNLIIARAYESNAEAIYLSGRTLSLEYYEYYNSSTDNKRSSIEGVDKYQWFYDHAAEYGFIQMYPTTATATTGSGTTATTNKGNIFRYVGVAHASYMKQRSLTLQEYLTYLKEKTTVSKPLSFTANNISYRVYYIASDATQAVPEKYTYTISGDNMGGYIVTVTVSARTSPPTQPIKKPESTNLSRSNYSVSVPEGVQAIEGISSQAAILLDLDNYSTIAAKNATTKIYPASMTKVMTLLVACENIQNLNELLTVTAEQVKYQADHGGSGNAALNTGEVVKAEDLLYLIIYNSDTIACLMISDYVSGSEAAFAELMNQKAKSMGLTGTHFVNSTGLHDDNHYTTCADMAAIMAYALDNPTARKILTSYAGYRVNIYQADGVNVTRSVLAYSAWYSGTDRFKDNPNLKTVTVKAGKTGYETIPTGCFVTYAVGKDGKNYVCVQVGRIDASQASVSAATSTADTKKIYNTYVK